MMDIDPAPRHAETATSWTALILAGQRPGQDPLAAAFGGTFKALVPIAEESMVTHVVRAVSGVAEVDRVVILSQSPTALHAAVSAANLSAVHVKSGGGIASSLLALIDHGAGGESIQWPLFVTTADHPLLTPPIIAAFLDRAKGCDVGVAMVERAIMVAAYPDNRRTWLKFSDGHWSGANLFALNGPACRSVLALWAKAEQDRKKPWKLFLHFGPWLALRALTRTIGLGAALAAAGKRLGAHIQLIPLADAEACIDVDKVSDHKLASEILERRLAR